MNKRPITADALLQFKFIGDPQVSPQGNRVAYVLTQMDKEKNGYYSFIYVSGVENEGRQYTNHYNQDTLIKDTTPKWSPDGNTLAFFSNRTGKNQIWTLSLEGGEATPLTDVRQGIAEFSWSPDGKQLVVGIKGELKKNLTSPGDLIVQDLTNVQSTQQITDWNKELLSEVSLSTPEGFRIRVRMVWRLKSGY